MKNYSELIKDVRQRTLTAKGSKFLYKCLDIIAEHKGTHKYAKDFKETSDKFKKIMYHLIIDKGMSMQEITDLIKSRNQIAP